MGQKIFAKLMFQPPVSRYPMNPEHLYLHSKSGSKLQVMYINRNAKYTMILSHGNAEDIYVVEQWLKQYFLKQVEVNCIVYEYTGYGESNGQIPAEQSLYEDIETVYLHLTENLNISPDRIILYGRSIGSGPTSFLAEKYPVAGAILHSGFMSAVRVLLNLRWTLPFDKFPNIDRMPNIECPVYVIHGTRDEIVPFYHAEEMHRATKHKYPPLYVEGAGHNNVEKFAGDRAYLGRINEFIDYVDMLMAERDNNFNGVNGRGLRKDNLYNDHDSDEEEGDRSDEDQSTGLSRARDSGAQDPQKSPILSNHAGNHIGRRA